MSAAIATPDHLTGWTVAERQTLRWLAQHGAIAPRYAVAAERGETLTTLYALRADGLVAWTKGPSPTGLYRRVWYLTVAGLVAWSEDQARRIRFGAPRPARDQWRPYILGVST